MVWTRHWQWHRLDVSHWWWPRNLHRTALSVCSSIWTPMWPPRTSTWMCPHAHPSLLSDKCHCSRTSHNKHTPDKAELWLLIGVLMSWFYKKVGTHTTLDPLIWLGISPQMGTITLHQSANVWLVFWQSALPDYFTNVPFPLKAKNDNQHSITITGCPYHTLLHHPALDDTSGYAGAWRLQLCIFNKW